MQNQRQLRHRVEHDRAASVRSLCQQSVAERLKLQRLRLPREQPGDDNNAFVRDAIEGAMAHPNVDEESPEHEVETDHNDRCAKEHEKQRRSHVESGHFPKDGEAAP